MHDSYRQIMAKVLDNIPDDEIKQKPAVIHDVAFELSEGEQIGSAAALKHNGWFGATWSLAVITNRRLIIVDGAGGLRSLSPKEFKLQYGALVGRDIHTVSINLRGDMQGSYEETSHFNKYLRKVFNS